MTIREAQVQDIPGMQIVRRSVLENRLSDPSRIQDQDYVPMLASPNKGWVAEEEGTIIGFAVADVQTQNIWALFLDPKYAQKGIGKALQKTMLDYALQKCDHLWLSTEPGSRAEEFYHRTGWRKTGMTLSGEVKFELDKADWQGHPTT